MKFARWLRKIGVFDHLTQREHQIAVAAHGDTAFAPHAALSHELSHRQSVDELVGNDDERPLGHVLDAVMPANRGGSAAKRRALRLAQAWADLDQRNRDALEKLGHAAPGADRIGHERAASW